MNAAAHAGFDAFFDESYVSVVDLLAEVFDSESIALHMARSSFASTYRFWNKLSRHDDPLEWTLTDAFSRSRRRWTDHATDNMVPTIGHTAAVLRRRGFTDAQLRNIIGPIEAANLTDAPPVSARGRAGIAAPCLFDEKRLVLASARRRATVAAVVLTAIAVVLLAVEIFVARG